MQGSERLPCPNIQTLFININDCFTKLLIKSFHFQISMVVGYGFKLRRSKWTMQKIEIVTSWIDYKTEGPCVGSFQGINCVALCRRRLQKLQIAFGQLVWLVCLHYKGRHVLLLSPSRDSASCPFLLLSVHHITSLHLISPRVLLSSYLCLTSATENYSCTFA